MCDHNFAITVVEEQEQDLDGEMQYYSFVVARCKKCEMELEDFDIESILNGISQVSDYEEEY